MINKRFVYIAQYFTPEPYLKDILFINDIKDKGWDPIVITGFPNYPAGKIYNGYKNRLFTVEIINGIRVIRVLTYSYHGLNAFKRVINYLTFAIFSSIAIVKYGQAKSTFYILQSSPFVVFDAWTIRIFKRQSKIYLDIQDVFPENIRISGFIKFKAVINFIDYCLNKFYYKSFDSFIVVSNSFKKILTTKNIPEYKIETVFNWSMVEQVNVDGFDEIPIFDKKNINIVYAGNIGVHQGLSKLIIGFNTLNQVAHNIKIHFFGDGTDFEQLTNCLKDNGSVVFHGRVNSSEIRKYLKSADFLFLHLVKYPIYECIIPSKLQAYIQIGKPILAGLEGEAKNIITQNSLGEVFEPENNLDFINALQRIICYDELSLKEIYKRSMSLYNSEFSRKAGVDKINKFLLRQNEI